MCSSFHAEKLARRCLTRITYFAILGSRDSYSVFTRSTTNWESLRIISLLVDIAVANSTPARMASYSDSLFEALKPSWIAFSILSPPEDFNYRSMPALVCRDAPFILRVHQFDMAEHISSLGILARNSVRTCPFFANLSLYRIPYSLSSIAQWAILPDKPGL